MSTKINIRIPDELLAKVDAQGDNRSATIIDILTEHFDPTFQPADPAVSADVLAAQEAQRLHMRLKATNPTRPPATSIYAPRPAHDPATCRVYKCGICAAK